MCYTTNTFNSDRQISQLSAYIRTLDRIAYIQKEMPDFKIEIMWEHNWDKMLKTDIELQKFIEKNPITKPLKLRDALFGGS